MDWLIPLVIGLVIGAVLTWVVSRKASHDSLSIAREQLQQKEVLLVGRQQELSDANIARERAESDLRHAQQRLDEQQAFVKEAASNLENKFAALSSKALAENSNVFLDRAKEKLEAVFVSTRIEIGQKHVAIDNLLEPLKAELKRLQDFTQALEVTRHGAYATLLDQVERLKSETGSLNQVLRGTKSRGRWGEFTLRRVVELAGLVDHCDFDEQVRVKGERGPLIPDMVVHLPEGRTIVVDAKVSIVSFQDAANASSDEERQSHLARHTESIRKHVRELSNDAYWSTFESSPDFVIMFVPGEAYFTSAVEIENNLIEEAIKSKVLIASPIMLVALLRTIAMIWRQSQLEENSKRISELGCLLHDRIATFVEHFEKVGSNLKQSVVFYNKARSSLRSRVLVEARRYKDLGVTPKKEIIEVSQIEVMPLALESEVMGDDGDEDL